MSRTPLMSRMASALLLVLSWLGLMTAGTVLTAQTTRSVPSTPERLAEMQHHFAQVMLIHEAVIRGDLEQIRTPAAELSKVAMPAGMPSEAAPSLEAIRAAGARAARATTLAAAANATVAMVGECAGCHRSVGVFPVPSTPRRPDVGGLVGHMLEHQRAADEMLQGLLIPSAAKWSEGAARLRAAALRPADLLPDPRLTRQVQLEEARVHQLADQAVKAETPGQRASTYVQLLASCAGCHSLHRGLWGPRAQR